MFLGKNIPSEESLQNWNTDDLHKHLLLCLINDNAQQAYEICANLIPHSTTFESLPSGFRCFGRLPIPFINMAASLGSFQCVSMFLSQGIDINSTDGVRNAVSHCACFSGNQSIVEMLEENGADFTLKNMNESLPIHCASENNQIETIQYLIENELSEIDVQNCFQHTPLSIAIQHDYIDLSKFLLINHSDPTILDEERNTLLHFIVSNNSMELLSFITPTKAIPINSKNIKGETPLLIAAKNGNIEIIQFLLNEGADPLITDFKNRNILMYTILSGNIEAVSFIISLNIPNVLNVDSYGYSPLHYAAKIRSIEIMKAVALLDDSHLNDVSSGFTPLHIACKHNNFEAVKFLCLHQRIDGFIENWCSQNAFHIAARIPNLEMFVFLYERFHYDLSIADINGIYLICFGHLYIMLLKKVLLKWLSFFWKMELILPLL